MGGGGHETANVIYYLTFTNNFDLIRSGPPDASILSVLWSIAIEEQFYLVWPLLLFVVPVKKMWLPFLAVIAGSLFFRAYYDDLVLNDCHTFSCISDMAIGAFGAWAIIVSAKFKNRIESLSRLSIVFIYLSFVAIYLFRIDYLFSTYSIRIFERLIIAVIMILIILEQSFSQGSFFKMAKFKMVRYKL